MKTKFFIICFASAVLFFPGSVFAQEPRNSGTGIVSVPLANVHEAPLPKSRLVTQVLMADEVRILERRDYRYRIAIPSQENREGWIQQEAVHVLRDKGHAYLNSDRLWIIIIHPKTQALILDKTGNHIVPLYAGTRLPVLERTADGYKVQFPDRSLAIISPADAQPVKSPDPLMNDTKPEDIAATARQFLTVRHLAGGFTAQGMDTRGLISLAYRIHGIQPGIDRASFIRKAERVSKKDLQPGDILIFFGEQEGLFLGNGRFLQVPRKSTVQPAGIYDKRFANALQYGLRVIGTGPEEKKSMAAMSADDLMVSQTRAAQLPLNKRITYWAGRFIGTPYDTDPLGLYVRKNRIITDEKADCMYLAFRSVELAQSETPGQAVDKALALRFSTQGRLVDGFVQNYEERYQYGEDMVFSGKWGKNVTAELGKTRSIPGSRGREEVAILPRAVLMTRTLQKNLRDGDILFWVKDPKKRVVEEIVAHLAIVSIKAGRPFLIHASGTKDRENAPGSGMVKEVLFAEYVRSMKFIGAMVTRFDQW